VLEIPDWFETVRVAMPGLRFDGIKKFIWAGEV
jgi:hypothetical protein